MKIKIGRREEGGGDGSNEK